MKLESKSIPKLKQYLWNLFRQVIYKRDGNTCFTCGRWCEGQGRHAGHFITGATCPPSLYFDERNVHVQCYNCNINKGGYWIEYRRRMHMKYGAKIVHALEKMQTKVEKWERTDYLKKIQEYKVK